MNHRFSEEQYIDQVVKKLDLIPHKYELEPSYFFNELEKATWHFEQPLNHPNTIGIYLLSQKAKKHVTVLLSGEGADEAFAGYRRFIDLLNNSFINRHFLALFKQNIKNLPTFLKYYTNSEIRILMSSAFGSISSVKYLKKDFRLEKAIIDRCQTLNQLSGDNLLRHRKYELLTYLPDLLMRQDKMSMAHSIENRVPFLDNEMIKISLNLPSNELINTNGIGTKAILKKSCAAKFGDKFAFRSKMGFGIPLKEFFNSKYFTEKWEDSIFPGIRKRNIFESKNIRTLNSKLNNLNGSQLDAIWLMTGFEIWAQQYLD